jgi:hypothetical protein
MNRVMLPRVGSMSFQGNAQTHCLQILRHQTCSGQHHSIAVNVGISYDTGGLGRGKQDYEGVEGLESGGGN